MTTALIMAWILTLSSVKRPNCTLLHETEWTLGECSFRKLRSKLLSSSLNQTGNGQIGESCHPCSSSSRSKDPHVHLTARGELTEVKLL